MSERDDVVGKRLVVTCTDDPAVNVAVARCAEAHAIWVNSADDPSNCSFTLPAVARQRSLMLTASTGGVSPALAWWLLQRFERALDDAWLTMLDLLCDVTMRGLCGEPRPGCSWCSRTTPIGTRSGDLGLGPRVSLLGKPEHAQPKPRPTASSVADSRSSGRRAVMYVAWSSMSGFAAG